MRLAAGRARIPDAGARRHGACSAAPTATCLLATNPASDDIGADGTIVGSNAQAVFVIERDEAARVASADHPVIEAVAA